MDRHRLPPLNALRAFEAVARHRSLKAAADELLVTPQAISQQLRTLEEHLGVDLLDRTGRSIRVTEAGLSLAGYVERGLQEWAEGVRMIRTADRADGLGVNVSPYFARAFIARLDDFQRTRPACRISLTTAVPMPQFGRDDVDAAIHWGYGAWPDLAVHRLATDTKVICSAPARLPEPPLDAPAALRHHKLLRTIVPNTLWPDLLDVLGVCGAGPENGLALADAAMMRAATIEGLGVGLLSLRDARDEMRAGTLVAPFGTDIFDRLPEARKPGFYLVYPRSHRRRPAVAALVLWMTTVDWSAAL